MKPVEFDTTVATLNPLLLDWVHSANEAVDSMSALWAPAWKDILADPETAANILERRRANAMHSTDSHEELLRRSRRQRLCNEPDEDVYHGAFDDVFDDDAAADTALSNSLRPLGVAAAIPAVAVVMPVEVQDLVLLTHLQVLRQFRERHVRAGRALAQPHHPPLSSAGLFVATLSLLDSGSRRQRLHRAPLRDYIKQLKRFDWWWWRRCLETETKTQNV